ncbi:MAG: SDR family oxidoreductase [Candidatus Hodarchaeota archaeon]
MGKTKEKKVVFITGTSSGFGYLTAKTLADKGHKVYASMRDTGSRNKVKKEELEKYVDNLKVVDCDVLSTDSVNKAIQSVIDAEDRIDVLINNAGYGLSGPVELTSDEVVHHLFDTNVYGTIRTIKAVLPKMREQRDGLIINFSSVVGQVSIPIEGVYCASKAAVEGLSEALLGEGYLFNIKVVVLQPHAFGTDFMGRSMKRAVEPETSGEYKKPFQTFVDKLKNMVNPKSSPQEVADKIAWIIEQKKPPFRVPVGKNARRDLFFSKLLAPLTLQKIAAKMYGLGDIFKKIPKE